MVNKMKAKSKNKTQSIVKAKAKMPIKAARVIIKKSAIVKRITFTTQEFKSVQQMLTANDCQTLKEWITKRIADHKLQQPSAST